MLTGTAVADCSQSATTASDERRVAPVTWEMTERFEIGLNDPTPVASRSGFFRHGVANALNAAGTASSVIDLN